jgi:hypothetical protein
MSLETVVCATVGGATAVDADVPVPELRVVSSPGGSAKCVPR